MENQITSRSNTLSKIPLIVLTGPTAVGKTELSIELAKAIDGEIISADSMQVYRRMDIGSAKITVSEMQGVRHHLIDILEPTQEFNIIQFQTLAKQAIIDIHSRQHIPIITGGTGFYIQSLIYDTDFEEHDEKSDYRRQLEAISNEDGGVHRLHEMLMEIDSEYAKSTHENNVRRVIRALEFYHETGRKLSEHNEAERSKSSPYRFAYFVLTDQRQEIYRRIDQRVDIMLNNGLLAEVEGLKNEGLTLDHLSMQGLGYKEIYRYLNGEITLDEAIYIIKRDTRHFAKRQLTWFRREKEVIYIDKSEYKSDGALTKNERILEYILNTLQEMEIITCN